ncbi:actin-like protein 7A [Clupea harengus]|uniref:Actin-like protein 7A n=1 Tax=Clupea harengus TaxID=7950 RepID=A0A6P3VEX9_CLUHA|nr:actin-like protein 7A [Clupea harengus]
MKSTRAVVFDVGSGSVRAGLAGEPAPTCVIPSLAKMTHHSSSARPRSGFVGADIAVDAPTVCPVRNGIITDWAAIEWVWECAFRNLNAPPERHAVLLSDPPQSPRTNREKLAEVLFETFCVPALYVENQSVLSVYSCGRTSGLVVESGEGCSYATPVHEGFYLPSNTCRVDYAGSSLDRYLRTLLRQSGTEIADDATDDIKQKCCYVTPDLDMELHKDDSHVEHVLPDGQRVQLGRERFLCPEALFQPSALGSRESGLPTLVMNCLNMCDISLKRELLQNVLLCGGSTLFRGLPERMQSELDRVVPGGGVRVVATDTRKHAVWVGGSILAALSAFQSMWMSRTEYLEKGPHAVYRSFI